jgi:hypothetical protein
MTQNFQLYLKYANDVEKCDPIMAAACRQYYVQCYIDKTKSGGSQFVSNNTSSQINGIITRVEHAHKAAGLNPDQRKDRVIRYCTLMHNKIVDSLRTPGTDKQLLLEMLVTMMNFIQVLTIYGPLDPIWIKNCNSSFPSIDNDCEGIMEGLQKAIEKEKNEAVKAPEQKEAARLPLRELNEGTTSKPLGTNLKYEEHDNSFECTDEDTENKAHIDYEDSFESVYFDEPKPKRSELDTISKEEAKDGEKEVCPDVRVNNAELHEDVPDIEPHKPSSISISTKSEQAPSLNSMSVVPEGEDINDLNVIPMKFTVPEGNDLLGLIDKPIIKEIPPDDANDFKASKAF